MTKPIFKSPCIVTLTYNNFVMGGIINVSTVDVIWEIINNTSYCFMTTTQVACIQYKLCMSI